MSAKLFLMALGMGLVGLGVSQAMAPQRYATGGDAARGRGGWRGRGFSSRDEGQRVGRQPAGSEAAPVSPETEAFARQAAIAEIYDVQAARLALNKAQSPDLRAFAALVIRDHTDGAGALSEATGGLAAPTYPDREHQTLIDRLNDASDGDFDSLYLQQQASALEGARSAYMAFLNQPSHDHGVRAFAEKLVSYLNEREKSLADLRRAPGATSH